MNKSQVEGRVKEAAGKVQEVVGRVTGSETQEAKGVLKKNLGAAEAKAGDVAEKAKDTMKDARKEAKRESRDRV